MKGLRLKGPKQMEVVEEEAKEPGKGQVLIRVDNFNLCGSDLRIYEGTYSAPVRYPLYVGHEWAGKVEAVGQQIRHLPAAEEHGRDQSGDDGNLGEVGHEKHEVLHPGVLREVAAHDLRLPLRQIERHPLALRDTRTEKDEKSQRLIEDPPRR